MRNHVEDGMGFSGLVPDAQERNEAMCVKASPKGHWEDSRGNNHGLDSRPHDAWITDTPAPAPAPLDRDLCGSRHYRKTCPASTRTTLVCGGYLFIGTKQAPAPAPKVTDTPETTITKEERQAIAWEQTFDLCRSLGMKLSDCDPVACIESFIRSLAQRAGEGYSVSEIEAWVERHGIDKNKLNDPHDGIAAVTKRKGG